MPGSRQPLEVLVTNGRKHLSKREIADRKSASINGEGNIKRLTAPSWLPKSQREEFNRVSAAVIKLMPNLVSRMDTEVIAAYCMARQEWLTATAHANRAMMDGDIDKADAWGRIQDRYFKQARACANDLGLTITSRCRLVIPEGARKPEENPLEKLMRERMARA